ncbi:MAG: hypothetical protein IT572_02260 [Deltaproteobacteria bacterium]|nr:hypothetical protein [Deltaproteobacteria bacterium]
MTSPLPPAPKPDMPRYLSQVPTTSESGEVFRRLAEFREKIVVDKSKWEDLLKRLNQVKPHEVSPFALRYLQPLQNFLTRLGAPSALTGSAASLGTPASALPAAKLAGPVGLAAVGGLAAGAALNDLLPRAGAALGDWAFETFGPADSSSWIWKLDSAFTRAFDAEGTVGDVLAAGLEAAVGPASAGTIAALDHLGFGGWQAFKKAWDF